MRFTIKKTAHAVFFYGCENPKGRSIPARVCFLLAQFYFYSLIFFSIIIVVIIICFENFSRSNNEVAGNYRGDVVQITLNNDTSL